MCCLFIKFTKKSITEDIIRYNFCIKLSKSDYIVVIWSVELLGFLELFQTFPTMFKHSISFNFFIIVTVHFICYFSLLGRESQNG